MKAEQERLRQLLTNTLLVMCKNGLTFQEELKIEGVIGVTLDNNDVFIIHVNEAFENDNTNNLLTLSTDATSLEQLPGMSINKKSGKEKIHKHFKGNRATQIPRSNSKTAGDGISNNIDRNIATSRTSLASQEDTVSSNETICLDEVKQEPLSPDNDANSEQQGTRTKFEHMTITDVIEEHDEIFNALASEPAYSGEPSKKRQYMDDKAASQSSRTSSAKCTSEQDALALHGSWHAPLPGAHPEESSIKNEQQDDNPDENNKNPSDWMDANSSCNTASSTHEKLSSNSEMLSTEDYFTEMSSLLGLQTPFSNLAHAGLPMHPSMSAASHPRYQQFNRNVSHSTPTRMSNHRNHPQYTCVICRIPFHHKKELDYHLTTVHEAKHKHACMFCTSVFSHESTLRFHMKIHSGEEKYECHICHKRFLALRYYEGHMNKHAGIKPYQCSGCKRSFNRRDNLALHKKNCAYSAAATATLNS